WAGCTSGGSGRGHWCQRRATLAATAGLAALSAVGVHEAGGANDAGLVSQRADIAAADNPYDGCGGDSGVAFRTGAQTAGFGNGLVDCSGRPDRLVLGRAELEVDRRGGGGRWNRCTDYVALRDA